MIETLTIYTLVTLLLIPLSLAGGLPSPSNSPLQSTRLKTYAKTPLACLTLAVTVFCFIQAYGYDLESVELSLFAAVLFSISLYDIDKRLIPLRCLASAIAIRLIYFFYALTFGSLTISDMAYFLFSALGVFVCLCGLSDLLNRFLKKESLGGGDIKLLSVIALYIGWEDSLILLGLACLLSLLMCICRLLRHGFTRELFKATTFPFAPAISCSCFLILFIKKII